MTTSVIEASSLCRVFASEDGREPVRAVDGITFAVPPEARLVALIGPDGAGKSTLMQMICGLVGQGSARSACSRIGPDDEDFRQRRGLCRRRSASTRTSPPSWRT